MGTTYGQPVDLGRNTQIAPQVPENFERPALTIRHAGDNGRNWRYLGLSTDAKNFAQSITFREWRACSFESVKNVAVNTAKLFEKAVAYLAIPVAFVLDIAVVKPLVVGIHNNFYVNNQMHRIGNAARKVFGPNRQEEAAEVKLAEELTSHAKAVMKNNPITLGTNLRTYVAHLVNGLVNDPTVITAMDANNVNARSCLSLAFSKKLFDEIVDKVAELLVANMRQENLVSEAQITTAVNKVVGAFGAMDPMVVRTLIENEMAKQAKDIQPLDQDFIIDRTAAAAKMTIVNSKEELSKQGTLVETTRATIEENKNKHATLIAERDELRETLDAAKATFEATRTRFDERQQAITQGVAVHAYSQDMTAALKTLLDERRVAVQHSEEVIAKLEKNHQAKHDEAVALIEMNKNLESDTVNAFANMNLALINLHKAERELANVDLAVRVKTEAFNATLEAMNVKRAANFSKEDIMAANPNAESILVEEVEPEALPRVTIVQTAERVLVENEGNQELVNALKMLLKSYSTGANLITYRQQATIALAKINGRVERAARIRDRSESISEEFNAEDIFGADEAWAATRRQGQLAARAAAARAAQTAAAQAFAARVIEEATAQAARVAAPVEEAPVEEAPVEEAPSVLGRVWNSFSSFAGF